MATVRARSAWFGAALYREDDRASRSQITRRLTLFGQDGSFTSRFVGLRTDNAGLHRQLRLARPDGALGRLFSRDLRHQWRRLGARRRPGRELAPGGRHQSGRRTPYRCADLLYLSGTIGS